MDKFWKWMAENGYGGKNNGVTWVENDSGETMESCIRTIIGFMMEYLDTVELMWCLENYCWERCLSTEERYKYLTDKISSIGGGK